MHFYFKTRPKGNHDNRTDFPGQFYDSAGISIHMDLQNWSFFVLHDKVVLLWYFDLLLDGKVLSDQQRQS